MNEETQIGNETLRKFVSDNYNRLDKERRELEEITKDYNQLNISQPILSQEVYQLELSQLETDSKGGIKFQDLEINDYQINNDSINENKQLELTDELQAEEQFIPINYSEIVDKNDVISEPDLSELDINKDIEVLSVQNINIQNQQQLQQDNQRNRISIEEDELEL